MRPSVPGWLHPRRAGDRWWHVGGTVVALVAIGIAIAALCLHAMDTSSQTLVLAASVSHQLMWAAPVGAVVAAAIRRWATTVAALGVCVFVALLQIPPLVAAGSGGPGRVVTVLQANLKIGGADAAALVRLVRTQHVEVLATEELTYRELAALLAAGLPRLLPYRFTAPLVDGGSGVGIWSRYPLHEGRQLQGYSAGVAAARVAVPGNPVSFLAVHLNPPYREPFATWRNEIAAMRGTLRRLPGDAPVVAAGDFNATVDHAQFRALLTRGYADAADQAGAGYLPTYPTDHWWGPVIGIDHVLTRDATAISADTFSLRGTDHRALLVRVKLR